MLKNKILPTVIICLFLYIPATGQEENNTSSFKHNMGFVGGLSTGFGISYRCYYHNFGIQTNFATHKGTYSLIHSTGLTFLFKITEKENINIFVYQGNHYYYKKRLTGLYGNRKKITDFFINGIGFGIELVFLENIGFNIMGGYGAIENFSRFSITGETGIFFKF